MQNDSVRSTVLCCLKRFLESTGRQAAELHPGAHLMQDLGLSSDEGVDLVLDLCEALHCELPHDFNPCVHESEQRDRQISELVERVEHLVASAGTAA
ncbi:MAG: hypothetical protein WBC44_02890 [Planctomycetaceae bacterium]